MAKHKYRMTVAFEFEVDHDAEGWLQYPGNVARRHMTNIHSLVPTNLYDLGDNKPHGFFDPTTGCTGEWQIQRLDKRGRVTKRKEVEVVKQGVNSHKGRKEKAKAKGDAISAVMAEKGIGFPEAMKEIAENALASS